MVSLEAQAERLAAKSERLAVEAECAAEKLAKAFDLANELEAKTVELKSRRDEMFKRVRDPVLT